MHAQLSDKKFVCKEFMQALEECHSKGWNKFLGVCNKQKDDLNHCLRDERISRTEENRKQAQTRRVKSEQALQEFRAI